MIEADLQRLRNQFAGALATFWAGGAGPTRSTLVTAGHLHDVPNGCISGTNKQELIRNLVLCAPDDQLWALIEHLATKALEGWDLQDGRRDEPDAQRFFESLSTLERLLGQYDYHVDRSNGRIVPGASGLMDDHESVASTRARLDRAQGDGDVELMLGTSKELIEATCRYVITELEGPVEGRPDMPELISRAQRSLNLHASQMDNGPIGDASRKVLGGLSSIANGINDLRNAGGTGHGRPDDMRIGLTVRHARMAVGAAKVYSQALIDTLNERRAR